MTLTAALQCTEQCHRERAALCQADEISVNTQRFLAMEQTCDALYLALGAYSDPLAGLSADFLIDCAGSPTNKCMQVSKAQPAL